MIFGIFDPFQKAQKWQLGQFLKYTPRNIPSGVKKSKKFGNIGLGNQIRGPKNVEKRDFCLLVIFGIFDPFQKAQKWQLGQFLKYIIRNISNGGRKSKKFCNLAIGNQIGCLKMSKKRNFYCQFSDFCHFWLLPKDPKMKIRPISEIYP